MLVALGCAPQDSSTATDTPASSDTTQTPADCAQGKTMTDGTLTIATDSPAYDPWFSHNDPTNGKGYESAVAYAVAKELGFGRDQVKWVVEPFNNSYAPGDKKTIRLQANVAMRWHEIATFRIVDENGKTLLEVVAS